MFVHSGASIHGHEYSKRYSSPQIAHNLRSPLLRSALTATPKRQLPGVGHEARPSALRQRPVSEYIPRTPEPVVRFWEPEPEEKAPMNEDASNSELSDATESVEAQAASPTKRRRRRRAPHANTLFSLGYPAPKLLGKKKMMQKVRPRLLLQLQQVFDDGRSEPVMEVFPSTRIAGPVVAPRLAQRFPGIFGIKRQLCYDDIVLVRRDDRDPVAGGIERSDEDGLENSKLLAVYSPLRNSQEAEIVLDDGTLWVASPSRNGSFDFVHVDERGQMTMARWARRNAKGAVPTAVPAVPSTATSGLESRFTFSILSPLSRRHPIMATLTPSSLEVQDTYTSVSSSYGRYHPVRPLSRNASMVGSSPPPYLGRTQTSSPHQSMISEDYASDSSAVYPPEPDSGRKVYAVDDTTKMLISVTALWVALSSGWSSSYAPSSPAPPESSAPGSPTTSSRTRRNTWTRANTSDSDMTVPIVPGQSSTPTNLSTVDGIATQSPAPCHQFSRSATPTNDGRPRRAFSSGAAFMQRRSQTQFSSTTHASCYTPSPASLEEPPSKFNRKRAQSAVLYPSKSRPISPSQPQPQPQMQMQPQPPSRPVSMVLDSEIQWLEAEARWVRAQQAQQQRVWTPMQDGTEGTDDARKGMRTRLVKFLHRLGGR